jgi:excisionase family DNA binding protein
MQSKNTKQTGDDLLSSGQAAAAIGISRDTLKRYEEQGRISSLRLPNNHRRYRRRDVEALLRTHPD